MLASSSGVSQMEYRDLVEKVAEAQRRAEDAQVAFEEHVASHQCEMLLAKSQQV